MTSDLPGPESPALRASAMRMIAAAETPERRELLLELQLAMATPSTTFGMERHELRDERAILGAILSAMAALWRSPRERRRKLVFIAAAALALAEQLETPPFHPDRPTPNSNGRS